MNSLEKQVLYYSLFAFYNTLLTAKQKQYFTNYFIENLSLQEIADLQKVSRTAVHDSLQKVIILLNKYESKLHLYEKYKKRQVIYEKYTEKYNFIKVLQEIDKIE
ncbi:MAG: DNA-binding protein [Spiroplasma sp. WSS]|uniref:YlxM family DNA-binding protein n=1 Tax=unclassified Spiroplasma TaxID=2637901 RepID=UPI00120E5952|nr:DNA-binding protein [Spiroplasma endosymbiont of Lariophagus distinguendus]TLF28512.1 MAG: DNA-binding protein [Spiroplasma sp. WSS]